MTEQNDPIIVDGHAVQPVYVDDTWKLPKGGLYAILASDPEKAIRRYMAKFHTVPDKVWVYANTKNKTYYFEVEG